MATDNLVQLCVRLRPVGQPCVKVIADGIIKTQKLTEAANFVFEFTASDNASLIVEHYNKDAADADTAVEIVSVSFFGIQDPKFAWAGIYTPVYPEPWASEQLTPPSSTITPQTYLGWNGTWKLDFSVPVFTWIHRVQNLGWLYQ
jgi:hypothetical protein